MPLPPRPGASCPRWRGRRRRSRRCHCWPCWPCCCCCCPRSAGLGARGGGWAGLGARGAAALPAPEEEEEEEEEEFENSLCQTRLRLSHLLMALRTKTGHLSPLKASLVAWPTLPPPLQPVPVALVGGHFPALVGEGVMNCVMMVVA